MFSKQVRKEARTGTRQSESKVHAPCHKSGVVPADCQAWVGGGREGRRFPENRLLG